MKVAIPLENGLVSMHFGHSKQFAIVAVDPDGAAGADYEVVEAPEGGHDLLAGWLRGHGVTMVISGGIGAGAVQLLNMSGIEVAAGASPESPEAAVLSWMQGGLTGRVSNCSCAHHGGCGHHDHSHEGAACE
ncbi:MAG: NifB/NifX family molybdenum-iron cluster-binding protein [Bryobacteraceae bacterium]|nr:NifB/NifX family molybdenum-iron cluster-binding protein [Bryobacteraceae bacterium]